MNEWQHERLGEVVSRGFDAGNYAEAYETSDYEKALKQLKLKGIPQMLRGAYRVAFTLGFFASYENHEIPSEHQEAHEQAYQSEAGQLCVALGLLDVRPSDPERHEEARDDSEGWDGP